MVEWLKCDFCTKCPLIEAILLITVLLYNRYSLMALVRSLIDVRSTAVKQSSEWF